MAFLSNGDEFVKTALIERDDRFDVFRLLDTHDIIELLQEPFGDPRVLRLVFHRTNDRVLSRISKQLLRVRVPIELLIQPVVCGQYLLLKHRASGVRQPDRIHDDVDVITQGSFKLVDASLCTLVFTGQLTCTLDVLPGGTNGIEKQLHVLIGLENQEAAGVDPSTQRCAIDRVEDISAVPKRRDFEGHLGPPIIAQPPMPPKKPVTTLAVPCATHSCDAPPR